MSSGTAWGLRIRQPERLVSQQRQLAGTDHERIAAQFSRTKQNFLRRDQRCLRYRLCVFAKDIAGVCASPVDRGAACVWIRDWRCDAYCPVKFGGRFIKKSADTPMKSCERSSLTWPATSFFECVAERLTKPGVDRL